LGFTLIELMVTLAVIVILAMLALPSFNSFQQRSALRGSAEQVVSFWNQARFEAAKRDKNIKVGVKTSGTSFCLGASAVTDAEQTDLDAGTALTSTCDCFTAGSCDVAAYPGVISGVSDQSEWQGVTFVTVSGNTPTLGGADNSVAVIEPKHAGLVTANPAGLLTFAAPSGSKSYKLNLYIDTFGKAVLCESNSDPDHMSDYFPQRVCSP
jgi:prepilin-type N-terminal cleavage/methylation domain-containing protein